jgi:hypothetical protein
VQSGGGDLCGWDLGDGVLLMALLGGCALGGCVGGDLGDGIGEFGSAVYEAAVRRFRTYLTRRLRTQQADLAMEKGDMTR